MALALQRKTLHHDLCLLQNRSGYPCPAIAGRHQLLFPLKHLHLPAVVASGVMDVQIEATNQDNATLTCLRTSVTIPVGLGGEIFRRLEEKVVAGGAASRSWAVHAAIALLWVTVTSYLRV